MDSPFHSFIYFIFGGVGGAESFFQTEMESFRFTWFLNVQLFGYCVLSYVMVFLVLTFCHVARAREDTEKIDRRVKEKAERLHHIATVCDC